MERHDQNLDEELAALPKEGSPPPALRRRVVGALKTEGIITPAWLDRRPWLRHALTVAAAAILLITGGIMEQLRQSAPDTATGKSTYMLLLYGATDAQIDPEQAIEEYRAWSRSVQAQGAISGDRLLRTGRMLRKTSDGGVDIFDYIADPARELRGYFLIEADDYDTAAQLAASCPHLKYGEAIEVREVDRR